MCGLKTPSTGYRRVRMTTNTEVSGNEFVKRGQSSLEKQMLSHGLMKLTGQGDKKIMDVGELRKEIADLNSKVLISVKVNNISCNYGISYSTKDPNGEGPFDVINFQVDNIPSLESPCPASPAGDQQREKDAADIIFEIGKRIRDIQKLFHSGCISSAADFTDVLGRRLVEIHEFLTSKEISVGSPAGPAKEKSETPACRPLDISWQEGVLVIHATDKSDNILAKLYPHRDHKGDKLDPGSWIITSNTDVQKKCHRGNPVGGCRECFIVGCLDKAEKGIDYWKKNKEDLPEKCKHGAEMKTCSICRGYNISALESNNYSELDIIGFATFWESFDIKRHFPGQSYVKIETAFEYWKTNKTIERKEPAMKAETEKIALRDLILLKDVLYFGRILKRGSTFKQVSKDWYVLWENKDGIIMHCPAIRLHFTCISEEYFVEQYE